MFCSVYDPKWPSILLKCAKCVNTAHIVWSWLLPFYETRTKRERTTFYNFSSKESIREKVLTRVMSHLHIIYICYSKLQTYWISYLIYNIIYLWYMLRCTVFSTANEPLVKTLQYSKESNPCYVAPVHTPCQSVKKAWKLSQTLSFSYFPFVSQKAHLWKSPFLRVSIS